MLSMVCASGANAVVIVAEWRQFRALGLGRLGALSRY
jgi:hypothetical protein